MSATTFVSWRRCPDSARARLEGHYGPETRASFTGALAHRLIARHLTSGPVAPDAVEQACREEIGAALNPKLGDLRLRPTQLRDVIAEVGSLYERFRRLPLTRPRGVEVGLQVEPAPDVVLVGAVDAVFDDDGGVRLVDWKTGGIGEPADQLDFYALVWALERGEIPRTVEAVSVKTGESYRAEPTVAGLEAVAGRVSTLVTEMRRSWEEGVEATRVAGPWCRFCPILDTCPEGRAAVDLFDAT